MPTSNIVGRQINDFTVIERIGRGGMATVYRAHQQSIHRDVALKVIDLDDTLEDPEFKQRFAQEAATIAALEHIHILPVYSYGIDGDLAYLAMRLLRGGSLADLIEQPLPLDRALELFIQIAQGLAHAHSKGVIHRDLKPSNILLDDVGHAYLTDFGLAKLIHSDVNATKTGNIVGTPAYMSPEQLRGDTLDQRSDIYSLGVILYQMLTGVQPFEDENTDLVAIIYRHLEKMPTLPSEYNRQITPQLEAVIMRALAKSPDQRFNSVGEMIQQLRHATGLPASSTGNFPAPAKITPSTTKPENEKRRLYPIIGGLFLLLILLITGLIFLFSDTTPSTPPIATVIVGQTGDLAMTIPTAQEVEIARRVLGENSFIAILPCNLTSEYNAKQTRELVEFAEDYGINTRVYDANSVPYEQSLQLERAITEGAHAFVLCGLDYTLLRESLRAIDQQNYPLVMAHPDGENTYGGVMIVTDNYLMGLAPGRYAGQLIRDELDGAANVLILTYPTLPDVVLRANGLRDGILEFAPNANIIPTEYIGGTQDLARESIEAALAAGVEFDVIASINDAGSYGAITALEAAGIDPARVIIVSVDAEAQALKFIEEGYFIRGSVELQRTNYAQAAIGSLIRQLAGATLPQMVSLAPGEVVTAALIAERATHGER
ncbi:MAG: protein kinase [Anaerolineae bacterium]|jgi:serine/threonine protein kinase/fructose-specific phosphotransferase system component IIB|nr:protein kinase [Anaerolineae bacterium]